MQVSTSLKNHNVAVRSKEEQLIKKYEICPEMHVNEIHLPHNKHHKVSSLMKFHQNTQNYIKYEVYENV